MQAYKALLLVAILMIAGTVGSFMYFNGASGTTTPTPTPTPTHSWPVPTPTMTPVPTAEPTPIPTAIPVPTATPIPTAVPTPTPTPWVQPTPSPTPIPTTGTVEINLRITWSDGTSTLVSHTSANLQPSVPVFSVFYQNKEIKNAEAIVKVTLNGQSRYWTTSVAQQIELYKVGSPIPKTSSTGSYTNAANSFQSGVAFEASHLTLTESQIDPVLKTCGAGDYTMQFNAQINLSLSGGTTLNAVIPSCLLYFNYQSGTPNYSVVINPLTF